MNPCAHGTRLRIARLFPLVLTLVLAGSLALGQQQPQPPSAPPLDPVMRGWGPDRDHRDDSHGVSVTVVERPLQERKGGDWGRGKGEVVVEKGTRIALHVTENDLRLLHIRVPLTFETLSHLIQDEHAPVAARLVAVHHILEAGLDAAQTERLLQSAVAIPTAFVRHAAWAEAFEAGLDPAGTNSSAPALVTPGLARPSWLHRVMLDPCVESAHHYLKPLVPLYDLRDAKGEPFKISAVWHGPFMGHYGQSHLELLAAAVALHTRHPELISAADIATIRTRVIPPDDWFRHWSPGSWKELRQEYLDHFQTGR